MSQWDRWTTTIWKGDRGPGFTVHQSRGDEPCSVTKYVPRTTVPDEGPSCPELKDVFRG